MRICKICGEEKELEKFRKIQVWRSHTCKKCYSARYATGKPNLGRFKKGQISKIKGKPAYPKRTEPKYIKKGREPKSENVFCVKKSTWALNVKTRDEFKCTKCGSEKNIQAHHIVPWKEDMDKRFDLDNGITLCSSCHMKEERLYEISKGIREKNGFRKLKNG